MKNAMLTIGLLVFLGVTGQYAHANALHQAFEFNAFETQRYTVTFDHVYLEDKDLSFVKEARTPQFLDAFEGERSIKGVEFVGKKHFFNIGELKLDEVLAFSSDQSFNHDVEFGKVAGISGNGNLFDGDNLIGGVRFVRGANFFNDRFASDTSFIGDVGISTNAKFGTKADFFVERG
jgi:hypothetical protein